MRESKKQSVKKSVAGEKFYLLAFWACISLSVVCFFRITKPSDLIYYSSLKQAFAWLAVVNGFLMFVSYLLPTFKRGSRLLKFISDNSIAFGWATLWFGALYTALVFVNSFGGWQGYGVLSSKYRIFFVISVFSLVFLVQTLFSKKSDKQLSLAALAVLISICLIDVSLQPSANTQTTPTDVPGGSIHAH